MSKSQSRAIYPHLNQRLQMGNFAQLVKLLYKAGQPGIPLAQSNRFLPGASL